MFYTHNIIDHPVVTCTVYFVAIQEDACQKEEQLREIQNGQDAKQLKEVDGQVSTWVWFQFTTKKKKLS